MILSRSEVGSITLPPPEFGYRCEMRRAIDTTETATGIELVDNGTAFDTRVCKIPRILFTAAQVLEAAWIKENQGEELTLDLGSSHTGFFPFGPDYGDTGLFTVVITARKYTGLLQAPYMHFGLELEITLQGSRSAVVPVGIDEGDVQIGNVTGLMYPQESINNPYEYGINSQVGAGGFTEHSNNNYDVYATDFILRCNTSKAAAVAHFFRLYGRAESFTIITGANNYLFGFLRGGSGSYTVKQVDPMITFEHINHEHFNIALRLQEVYSD